MNGVEGWTRFRDNRLRELRGRMGDEGARLVQGGLQIVETDAGWLVAVHADGWERTAVRLVEVERVRIVTERPGRPGRFLITRLDEARRRRPLLRPAKYLLGAPGGWPSHEVCAPLREWCAAERALAHLASGLPAIHLECSTRCCIW